MKLNELFYNWRKTNGLTQVDACKKLNVCRATYLKFEGDGDISIAFQNKFFIYYLTHRDEFTEEKVIFECDPSIKELAETYPEALWEVVNIV